MTSHLPGSFHKALNDVIIFLNELKRKLMISQHRCDGSFSLKQKAISHRNRPDCTWVCLYEPCELIFAHNTVSSLFKMAS